MTADQHTKTIPKVYAIATLDTKSEEIVFVAKAIQAKQVDVVIVDVGTTNVRKNALKDIEGIRVIDAYTVAELTEKGPSFFDSETNGKLDRGSAVAEMSGALAALLVRDYNEGKFTGVIGIGGGGGTSLIAHAMQALPIGVPKLMVSTMVSGNVAPYVDCTDITLMYSVVDIAGMNAISSQVLSNAAAAISGMAAHASQAPKVNIQDRKQTLALSMFGVTTPCVDAVRKRLSEAGYHCLVFHATGAGGRAMEKLVASGLIGGVLDITTTEIADEVVGGTLSAGPQRLDAILASERPFVMSLGALDMVNFAGMSTVPDKFKGRHLHAHNPDVTLMRTNADECRAIGHWIAEKLNTSTAPLTVLIPEKGVSMMDAKGQPFYDPEADAALIDGLKANLNESSSRRVRCFPYNINAPEFSEALVAAYLELENEKTSGKPLN